MASIVYVDYGNKEEKPFSELFAVDAGQDDIIRSTSWLVIPCALYGFTGQIDEATIDLFIKLTSADVDDDEVSYFETKTILPQNRGFV